jgi:hypothetical protein
MLQLWLPRFGVVMRERGGQIAVFRRTIRAASLLQISVLDFELAGVSGGWLDSHYSKGVPTDAAQKIQINKSLIYIAAHEMDQGSCLFDEQTIKIYASK